MNDEIKAMIKSDIERCRKAQADKTGSGKLFRAMVARYNTVYSNFGNEIPQTGKATVSGEFDYRPELQAVAEKLEIMLCAGVLENKNGADKNISLKEMIGTDIETIRLSLSDCSDTDTSIDKLQLYKELTAKYHPLVPQFGEGLYGYSQQAKFYQDVGDESLKDNLFQIQNKLLAFRAAGYPFIHEGANVNPGTLIKIDNRNENQLTVNVTFDEVRKQVDNMTALPAEEISTIQEHINQLEEIVKSQDSKSGKWEKAKGIIKWIADKGVDVGIALLPLLLKISA